MLLKLRSHQRLRYDQISQTPINAKFLTREGFTVSDSVKSNENLSKSVCHVEILRDQRSRRNTKHEHLIEFRRNHSEVDDFGH